MRSKALFLIFQALNIASFSLFANGAQTFPLVISGMATLLLYGAFIYGLVQRPARSVSPIMLYMITALFRSGIAPIFLAAAYYQGLSKEMFFVFFDPEEYIGRGYLLLVTGEWIFLAGYFFVESNFRKLSKSHSFSDTEDPQWMLKTGVSLIILAWMLRIIYIYDMEIVGIGRIITIFRYYSSAAGIYFLLLALRTQAGFNKQKIVLFLAILTIAELTYALQSYMKQDTIIVLLPIAIYYFSQITIRKIRPSIGWKRIVPITIIAYLLIMVLFPYSQIRRMELWQGTTHLTNVEVSPYLTEALSASVPGTPAFKNSHKFPDKGVWSFFARNEWITVASWAISRVEHQGTLAGKTLKDGLIAIIPRIFWKEKPLIAPGRDFAVVLGQAKSFEAATTSTGLGLAPSFYWNGGILLLVLGMFLNGIVLSKSWQIFRPHIFKNPVAMIVYIMLLLESLRQFEGAFDGSIAYYAYIFIVLYPLMRIFQVFQNKSINRTDVDTANKAIAG
jgi:hypothetical protein